MLLNFQNVEDIIKVLDNLTPDEKNINKIDLQYLDDRCAEIFEY